MGNASLDEPTLDHGDWTGKSMNLKLSVLTAMIVAVLPLAQSAHAQDTSGVNTYSGGILVNSGTITMAAPFSSNLNLNGSITTSGSGTLVLINTNSFGGNLVLSNSPLTVGGTISTVNSGTLQVTAVANLNLSTVSTPSTPIVTILPTVSTLQGTLTLSSTIFAPVNYLVGASFNSNGMVNNADLQAFINVLKVGNGNLDSGSLILNDSGTSLLGLSDTMATGGTLTLLTPGSLPEADGSSITSAIPEPASVVLIACGAALLLAGRRVNGRRR